MKKYLSKCILGICLLVLSLGMTVCAEDPTILKGVMIDQVDVSGKRSLATRR